ncbi:hypothetical protein [Citromicrobium sp. JLT1363]|uniref:hypothetical protein n=1 Tax=Citromicrobium sp. JLT1363 TaxID=517722 RepID=UPI000225E92C|nr:hypothetical protein [Citromicrobium sp. JLT1363]
MAVRFAPAALTLTAALCLAACGEPEETTYEVDAVDKSGGELIVADEDAQGVPVNVPETEMTNVPPEEMAEDETAQESDTTEE